MKYLLYLTSLLFVGGTASDKVRTIHYDGKDYLTTYETPAEFIGIYKGSGEGYLQLNADGTGVYHYDVFFAPPECKKAPIPLEWGFLLDENNQIVFFNRKYGRSYPLLLKSTGETSFQGCRKPVMLDFILDYSDGPLVVSSSDDWVKE
jgi:hypothetical protein